MMMFKENTLNHIIKSGEKIKQGDLLITFDKEAIEKAGYETVRCGEH